MKKIIRILPAALALAGILMLAGCGGMSEAQMTEAVDKALTPGDSFAMSELLYYNGEATDSINPNYYYEYLEDGGIAIADALTGESVASFGGAGAVTTQVDEKKWSESFASGLAPDLSGYSKCIEYAPVGGYRFYIMDSELWLGVYSDAGLQAMFKLEKK